MNKQLHPKDEQSLESAFSQSYPGATRFSIPVYDDGYGPLWIHRDSMGISGIVRAKSWEDAYEICEDEFFPSCDLSLEELKTEYGFRREHKKIIRSGADGERPARPSDYPLNEHQFVRWETKETRDPDAWPENECFLEAYGWRPNGQGGPTPEKDNGIYAKDLNGELLAPLTHELAKELGIKLRVASE